MRSRSGRYIGYSYVAAYWVGRLLKIYAGIRSESPEPPVMQYSGTCPSDGIAETVLATVIATLMPDTMSVEQAYLEGMRLLSSETEMSRGITS